MQSSHTRYSSKCTSGDNRSRADTIAALVQSIAKFSSSTRQQTKQHMDFWDKIVAKQQNNININLLHLYFLGLGFVN